MQGAPSALTRKCLFQPKLKLKRRNQNGSLEQTKHGPRASPARPDDTRAGPKVCASSSPMCFAWLFAGLFAGPARLTSLICEGPSTPSPRQALAKEFKGPRLASLRARRRAVIVMGETLGCLAPKSLMTRSRQTDDK